MPVYDNNGTTNKEIGKLYDNNGSANTQIDKVYDNNGSANSLIYTAREDTIYLYQNGDLKTAITGGWSFDPQWDGDTSYDHSGCGNVNGGLYLHFWANYTKSVSMQTVKSMGLTEYKNMTVSFYTDANSGVGVNGDESIWLSVNGVNKLAFTDYLSIGAHTATFSIAGTTVNTVKIHMSGNTCLYRMHITEIKLTS